ncbi:M56 family metallopeptidase [Gaetbulibacter sp. PBL-D1]|uniref:M56 family metallopeptidase n=1 Tax=Gaetbulibacter sp. PBL-D1 TaxID=3422594 RepID=UPI003D2F07C5
MLDYILKSSACLLVLLLFYKLILERENMHQLKRFYLLFATVLGFTIPFITITTYVEPTYTLGTFQPPLLEPVFYPETTQPTEQNTNFWSILLWSIYGIGVLLFLVKFMVNLTKLIVKIKTNPKLKSKNIINVLINNLEIPHTFLSYIFLNKAKFENNQIPEEVLLHEHTHATQKHSLDILFIELLQIVFWFNPIIYFLKKDVKLNHEYLADQAVLQQGTQINTYQHLLLAFSSTHGGNELTNAINYSSIKKRLTVMKTQTSSTKKWIKTLVVLPLLAILIFGFSKKEEVVKEVTPLITENNHTTTPVLEVKQNQSILILNNENTSLESLGEDFLSITKGEKSDLKIISEENIKMSFIEQISEALKPNLLQIYFESEYGITHDNFNFNSDKEIVNNHIENKPLLEFINGIKTDCNQCALSKNLIGQLAITTTLDETVEEFKIQFKNEDAFLVKGNQLDARAQELLKKMNHNDLVFIYDIKTKFKTFKNKIQLKAKITKQDENKGASEEQMQEYRNFINEYKSTNVVYSEKHKRAVIIYDQLMTDKQRASVDKYPSNLIPDSNLSKTQPKQPTSSEFESWKNEKEFAIWLDGKPIPNSNLSKLSANDIVYYTGSFVHNNARSDRFPQPYQYSLYTKKGFENTYQKANVNQYKKASEAYTNAIQNFLKGSQEDNSELKILKAQADKIYNTFTKEELKENNILQTPPLPAQKKAFNNWVKVENILEQSSQDTKGVTKEELKEYNTLAKHINSQISESEYPIVKHKDAVRVKYLYNKMSKEQKESAEAFPDFSKLPPPPPPAPDPNVKTGFITINNSTHYYVTQNGNTKYYNRYGQETNKEGTIINDTQVDGDKVVPGQKITKVYKDDKVVSEFNKNWDQDVPPPPPPPKSPLDHIIDMAKKGAAFFYEGKSISSDEAIALLKKNNELNISTQQTDSKQAKVYITKAPVSIKN